MGDEELKIDHQIKNKNKNDFIPTIIEFNIEKDEEMKNIAKQPLYVSFIFRLDFDV